MKIIRTIILALFLLATAAHVDGELVELQGLKNRRANEVKLWLGEV